MASILEVYTLWANMNFDTLVDDSIREKSEVILDLNRQQMLDGETAKGEEITPKYSENHYFKSVEKAQNYAAWKMNMFPSDKRDIDTPNLIVNGNLLHNPLTFDDYELQIIAPPVADDIIRVHKDVLGLNEEKSGILAQEHLLPVLQVKIRNAVKL